jgi:hypothetical protein
MFYANQTEGVMISTKTCFCMDDTHARERDTDINVCDIYCVVCDA